MTTRYRVEYALKTHRRDQFIEWIKGLLAVPFVLLSQPTAIYDRNPRGLEAMTTNARQRYAEIMRDVEALVDDHIAHQGDGGTVSKLKLLVPSLGQMFTGLPLEEAFRWQDARRFISSRRFVAPSFNDIRLILNTAQVMALVRQRQLQLVTFDGDVTLYDDGQSLTPDNPCIPRILALLEHGVRVGIVTAAGYVEAEKYYERLHGLLDAIAASDPSHALENRLVVVGGESSFMFTYAPSRSSCRLQAVARTDWQLPEMAHWTDESIKALLDVAEAALRDCVAYMQLPVGVLRKERAVGIYPTDGVKLTREQLEETVLVTQRILETSPAGQTIPFCAFNGGNDVFVDIGDKSWGVRACQQYFGGIDGAASLHVGDQFLSAGANDFKARLAATTAWIASPAETVNLLDEIAQMSAGSRAGVSA
nr:IMP-specific 5'-nucleotidase 1-like [Quercus suber]